MSARSSTRHLLSLCAAVRGFSQHFSPVTPQSLSVLNSSTSSHTNPRLLDVLSRRLAVSHFRSHLSLHCSSPLAARFTFRTRTNLECPILLTTALPSSSARIWVRCSGFLKSSPLLQLSHRRIYASPPIYSSCRFKPLKTGPFLGIRECSKGCGRSVSRPLGKASLSPLSQGRSVGFRPCKKWQLVYMW